MKNILKIALALIAILSLGSCEKFLEEDLRNELAPTNTYTSTYGFEVGSAGLYALTRSEYNTYGEGGAFIHNGAAAYEALQAATDIADVINSDASLMRSEEHTSELQSREKLVCRLLL